MFTQFTTHLVTAIVFVGLSANVSACPKNGVVGYGLDPVGNRLSTSSTLSGVNSGTFGYNADDQLSTESFVPNGNTVLSGGKSYGYDSENRLTSMNGGAVRQVYDAFGNRVSKTVNGVTTQYLVEDDVNPTGLPQVIEEIVNGVVQREYAYGLQRISEFQNISGTWTPRVSTNTTAEAAFANSLT